MFYPRTRVRLFFTFDQVLFFCINEKINKRYTCYRYTTWYRKEIYIDYLQSAQIDVLFIWCHWHELQMMMLILFSFDFMVKGSARTLDPLGKISHTELVAGFSAAKVQWQTLSPGLSLPWSRKFLWQVSSLLIWFTHLYITIKNADITQSTFATSL